MVEYPSIRRVDSGSNSLTVDFLDVTMTFDTSDKKGKLSKRILNYLSGSFEAGKLTAIIGPSGCGKSTLLNFLSGRIGRNSIAGSNITGTVSLNGSVVEPVDYKQRFAYVMAEDALYSTTTPREAFEFACKLRLPHFSPGERHQKVEDMLASLGLVKCADTYIGNALIKGVSSGEKKRTAVGIELLPNPDVCFLDEPTTGLDSHSALELVKVVKDIADSGKTVIAVIHQPSTEIFNLFDDVMFMSKGQIVYHGPIDACNDYFSKQGHKCPADYNPADYIMYLLQTIDDAELSRLAEAWKAHCRPVRESILAKQKSSERLKLKPLKRVDVTSQMQALLTREARRLVRDPYALLVRLGITVFLGFVVGVLFYNVGTSTGPGGSISDSHRGGLTNICIFAMMGSGQAMLISLPFDRPVILREYANGMYSIAACVLSRVAFELPIIFAQNLLLTVIVYFLEGFVGSFMMLVLALFLLGSATSATALLFGSSLKEVDKAVELGFLLFVPQLMFSGFFVSMNQIPAIFRWAQWLCGLKYAINIAYIAEFTDLPGHEQVFAYTDINPDQLWVYILVLCSIIMGFTILSIFMLRYRSKSVF